MPIDAKVPSHLHATGEVELLAAESSGEAKLRRFKMVAYTGGAMQLGGWPYPVVVDLAGMKVTAKARPILRDHDASKIVGHTEAVDIQPKRIEVTGLLSSGNGFARDVETAADNGFPWQSSIGASVQKAILVEDGETVEVNGRSFTGPLYVARRTTLGEISFVALGADDNTSARLAASAAESFVGVIPMTLEKFIEAKGFTLEGLSETQLAFFKAAHEKETAPPPKKEEEKRAEATKPEQTETLANFFAEQQKEQARIEEITRITIEAGRDRPMMTEQLKRMSEAAIEAKSTPHEYELMVLKARLTPSNGVGRGNGRDRKIAEKVLTAAVCKSAGLPDIEKHFDEHTLEAMDEQFRDGIGLVQLFQLAAKENGHGDISPRNSRALLSAALPPQEIRGQGWSTFSLAGILGNVANKFIGVGFNSIESTWRSISATRSVKDFKTYTSYSLVGDMMYEKVGAQGELKHGEVGEQSYTNKAETYGKMFALSRQDFINDDLGILDNLRTRIGRGGALKLNDVFWAEFMDNSTFFTAARGNYDEDTDTALSIGGLTLANTLFGKQTDPDGYPLGISPRILLVPTELGVTGTQLMNTVAVVDGTGTALQPASNPFANRFRVVESSYLSNSNYTGYSPTAWYLLADPADLPVIEVAFLNGRDMPIVESADADFNTLGVQFRGYFDFGVALQEYRAGVQMAGVNV